MLEYHTGWGPGKGVQFVGKDERCTGRLIVIKLSLSSGGLNSSVIKYNFIPQ